jgi:ribosome maturation factor RimP
MNQSELQKLVDSTLEGMEGFAVEVSLSASNAISSALGEQSEDYAIEVSSPGMFSPFTVEAQFRKNIGREVVIKLKDGLKANGKMTAYDSQVLTLERTERVAKLVGKGKVDQIVQTQIPLEELSSITLDFKF